MSLKSMKWLTTLDLENFILQFANEATRKAFLGVFPMNYLPRNISQLPVFFIINTNTSNLPGQHWKAVYISTKRLGEVFDSLATPVGLQLQQWMNRFTKKWTPSSMTLQNPISPSCGAYVLYFVMTRMKHKSLKSCLLPFTNNVVENDRIVEQFLIFIQ